jgi:phosphatidylethanolamine-binding protein (PEBP) family uncharacterized protein
LEPIAPRFTCDGGNVSLPVAWTHVPLKAVEADLFIYRSATVHGANFAVWAVAGLKPQLSALPAGLLPGGAVIGRNGYGRDAYDVCPLRGKQETYLVALLALPRRIPVKPGFNPDALLSRAQAAGGAEGQLSFFYKRPR